MEILVLTPLGSTNGSLVDEVVVGMGKPELSILKAKPGGSPLGTLRGFDLQPPELGSTAFCVSFPLCIFC